jgi:hypothetical protein
MLSVSSEVTFRKNLEGSRTQGWGPPSNSISFEEPRVTTATEEGSTAWGGRREKTRHSSGRQRCCKAECLGSESSPCSRVWGGRPGKPPMSSLNLGEHTYSTVRVVMKIPWSQGSLERMKSSLGQDVYVN